MWLYSATAVFRCDRVGTIRVGDLGVLDHIYDSCCNHPVHREPRTLFVVVLVATAIFGCERVRPIWVLDLGVLDHIYEICCNHPVHQKPRKLFMIVIVATAVFGCERVGRRSVRPLCTVSSYRRGVYH